MLRRINRLIIIIFIASASIYFVTKNRGDVVVSLSPGNTISASIGVIVLGAFALGILMATLVGAIFALQGYLRERKLISAEMQRRAFEQGVLRARSLAASGEHVKALEAWQKILKKDPTLVTARIEISKLLQAQGNIHEAIKVIDEARTAASDNIEVLFRASELHLLQGNKTAAIDNLMLVLHSEPNAKAARIARSLSRELGRIEDAIEFNTRLQSIEGLSEDVHIAFGDLYAQKIITENAPDDAKVEAALYSHIREYPKSHVAFEALAEIQFRNGIPDDAAQYYVKAHKITRDIAILLRARNIWIESGYADKAVSLMKSWCRDAPLSESVTPRLELAKTYLLIGRDIEAGTTISELQNDANARRSETSEREIAVLKALIAYRSRNALESEAAWREVELLELGNNSLGKSKTPASIAAGQSITYNE